MSFQQTCKENCNLPSLNPIQPNCWKLQLFSLNNLKRINTVLNWMLTYATWETRSFMYLSSCKMLTLIELTFTISDLNFVMFRHPQPSVRVGERSWSWLNAKIVNSYSMWNINLDMTPQHLTETLSFHLCCLNHMQRSCGYAYHPPRRLSISSAVVKCNTFYNDPGNKTEQGKG